METTFSVPLHSAGMPWERALRCLLAFPLLASAVFAQDSDLDGIPDAWESLNYLDPDNDSDAHLDFDRDGLDSLQEYQLSLLGKGTGLKGRWSATLVNLNQIGSKWVVAINDEDDVLVNVAGYPTDSAWVRKNSDGTWKQISTINGTPAFIQGLDLNNEGKVVGRARPVNGGANTYFGFVKDLNASPYDTNVSLWFSETDSTTPVRSLTAINNWGDVIGRRADNSSFLQSRFYGDVSPPSAWNSPVFTALNDWGQVTGIELSDPNFGLDIWSHFLFSQEWTAYIPFPSYLFSEYGLPDPGTEEWMFDSVSYTPSLINDWGEFAGKFSVLQGEGEDIEVVSSYWFYDGTADPSAPFYRPILPFNYERQVIHALNNWPQMIVTGIRPVPWAPDPGEPQEYYPPETFLCVGDIRVPLGAIAPVPSVVNDDSFQVIGINNRSTILASVGSGIYLLRLNQDADGDQIPDDWEEFHGMNPLAPSDAGDDDDGDGYSNITEYRLGGDPTDNGIHERPVDGVHRPMVDGDGDGLPDAWERKFFPGLPREQVTVAGDPDNDLLTNGQEWLMETDPTKRDTDRDGAHDGDEVYWYLTDARNPDSDGDGIVDGDEAAIATDPLDPNSNGVPPTFLNIAEKVTFYNSGDVWMNWIHDSPPVAHRVKEDPNDPEEVPDYPTYSEVLYSHEGFNYNPLSDDTPFTMSYPDGQTDYNPESAYQYGSDGFVGNGFPKHDFGNHAPADGFKLHSWKVRAERKSSYPIPATQTWLVVETDFQEGEIQDVTSFQLEIGAGKTVSDQTKEILPGARRRAVVLPALIQEVSFAGSAYHQLKSDNGATTYNAPHWVDVNGDGTASTGTTIAGEKNYPVAFTRNTKPKVAAKFRLVDLPELPEGETIKIKAELSQGLQIPETVVIADLAGQITFPLTEVSGNLADSIGFFSADGTNAFQINWKIQIGERSWVLLGSTKHTVYITRAAPIKTAASLMRETLFSIGCRNAGGLGDAPQAVVDAIYADFQDRDVQRVKPSSGTLDGNPMKYWGNPPTAGFTTAGLLESGDGRCGAWTRIFVDVLRAQGIDSNLTGLFAPVPPDQAIQTDLAANLNYGGPFQKIQLMYVKNWTIAANPFNPVDNMGIAAQNNANPQAYFGDHFVVNYSGKFFDPSYGSNVFATHLEWEDAALDAFGAVINIPQSGTGFWVWKADPKGTVETQIQNIIYENINQWPYDACLFV